MSLWKFIENKLAETGHDERWLEDECGFTGYMLPRIQAGGTIQNATKQKIAKAFKCSIGDINAAIAQIDKPEQKQELPAEAKAAIDKFMSDGPAKIPAEVKEVVDGMLNDIDNIVGREVTRPDPEKTPVKESTLNYNMERLKEEMAMPEPGTLRVQKIKWYPDQGAIDAPQCGPVAVITEPKVTVLELEAYKAKLKDTMMKLTVAEDWPTSNILFEKFGRAVAKDLMEKEAK